MSRENLSQLSQALPRISGATVDPQTLALAKKGGPQMDAIAPPDEDILTSSFAGGMVTSMSAEAIPANASPLMVDFEVTRGDRLVRAPGTVEVEVLDHAPTAMLVHSNLDASSELILFAAPFVGRKSADSILTSWENEGILPGGHWVGTNYAGSYIFTNAREVVYSREPHDQRIRATTVPVGRTLAAWNGRLWVGNAIIGGNFLPMGIIWSSAVGGFEDFTGLGTGFEELIYDFAADDGIVALRPMSLDFMAILCKKSLWIATRTSDVNEPGNITPVEPGIGCISESTARLVYGGVEYLSDVGVQIFDGQKSNSVSEQINTELLPIDKTRIDQYWGHYDALHRRYILGTPNGTWVHDISFNRWYKRSLQASAGVNFPSEVAIKTWADEVGTWADATDDWADYDPQGSTDRTVFVSGAKLHAEDYTSDEYFDAPFMPTWRSKAVLASRIGQQIVMKGLQCRYKGSGEITVRVQDSDGDFVDYFTRRLPDTGGRLQDATYVSQQAGLRGAIEIQLLNGFVELDMVGMTVQQDAYAGIAL